MRPFAGCRVLLGITGGIASYKSAWLARLLTKAGAEVDVVLTSAALEFIGRVTFEALTGRPAHTGLFDEGRTLDHIKLARSANAVVVAPATADFIARAAGGQAGDLLSAVLLATRAPVLFAPAMNDVMWAHRQTAENVHHLESLGYRELPPDEGMLAAGEAAGPGAGGAGAQVYTGRKKQLPAESELSFKLAQDLKMQPAARSQGLQKRQK